MTSTRLKALIRNLSKINKVEAEVLLRNYMLERFLERVSLSRHKCRFILKGGMLISAMVGIDSRTTMDLDATIKGQALSAGETIGLIKDILTVPIEDNVLITYQRIEDIRQDADYPGYRVSLDAVLQGSRQTLHIDVTTGDFVTPREIEYRFRLMFEDRTISIMAYNLETVLAEKFESVITRGLVNTRMRDFYDIFMLTTSQAVDEGTFNSAIHRTARRRQTAGQIADAASVIQHISASPLLKDLWSRYQKKYSYASDVTWEMTMDSLRKLEHHVCPNKIS